MTTAQKTAKCKHCSEEYIKRQPLQAVCGLECALARSRQTQRDAAEKARKKRDARVVSDKKRQQMARKEALKSKTDWAAEAQASFNMYIRMRDYGQPCISCDRPHTLDHQRHASHYRSVKAAKQLRYSTWNVHSSCAQCNMIESGNAVEYRIRLVKKIGAERVEWLESNHGLANYDIEYLKRVKRIFSKRARNYKKWREASGQVLQH